MITKVSHVTVYVSDRNRAYDVYVNKLGFKVVSDMKMDNGFRWLTVSPPGAEGLQMLLAEPNSPMVDAALRRWRPPTPPRNGDGYAAAGCGGSTFS